jgi:hypothetical protein
MAKPFAKIVSMLTPKRRWAQFGLATMFVLVAIAAVPCAWLAWNLDNRRRERTAESAIDKLDATRIRNDSPVDGFIYEDESDHGQFRGPQWLRGILGEDFYAHTIYIQFGSNGVVRDADLAHLERLAHLKALHLPCHRLTDAGLVHLSRLVLLKDLEIQSPNVTDAGLIHLEGLTSLEMLDLSGAGVTDRGVVRLGRLSRLQVLCLSGTQVTDTGLFHLQQLRRLTWLTLDRTKITNVGLAQLVGLKELRHLSVAGTQTTEIGLVEFEEARPDCKVYR